MEDKQETIRHSLFDDPVDLFHFSQIRPPSSRSMPASRRNSSDDPTLDVLLGAKLSLNETESSQRRLPFVMTTQDSTEPEVPMLNPLLSHSSEYLTPKGTHRISSTASTTSDDYPELFHLDAMTHSSHKQEQRNAPIMTLPYWTKRVPYWPTQRQTTDMPCPQFQQFGFCSRYDCLFQHPPPYPSLMSTYRSPSLYQQCMTSPATSQPVFTKSKRQQDRFANAQLDQFVGKLYDLCKDQNGCRFLQRQIEQDKGQLDLVFDEIHGHFIELMTDPFGNYLCQKIIECSDDEQRHTIVKTVAPDLVHITLNVHGTRAAQKLIECLSTPEQIHTVVAALRPHVVTLIKDLNGNHVIQKCLSCLSSHNQFIYDVVCQHCIEVASHKHGCCVLQRCFDHATALQKDQLVHEIAQHALTLVQNAFGNYVVQYVLELGVPEYSESIIQPFIGQVCLLSIQKFSSNVIENCIRTAQPKTRRLLIAELLDPIVTQRLLHDSFANYVIQTSLDFADPDQRAELVECIRPLLPTIRSTPYGKRIYNKIAKDAKSTSTH
ncbi:Pumilio domain-containing protein C6G9.14 [Choanephora cucurbitarum]|uniref:Pumilio domain-containing protein C6G9.14 n=1 Tax=Choanephora cucurbitarum TaxID=101091 RepID=A0A1C7N9K0_9FUNG|nr:Pumilio domain-containing protein C6G9.14 [Choanephora cucurbitarum]